RQQLLLRLSATSPSSPSKAVALAQLRGMLSRKQGIVAMRKITFAVYGPPKEGLPYLAVMIAPNGDIAAAASYKTAAEAEAYSLNVAKAAIKVLQ
ncbi:MAG: hypothetical protein QOG74_566, partial [Alphaproteobacteria bacterium]|nr:hypothetical protein [Alphaproteobacteria bacterium]